MSDNWFIEILWKENKLGENEIDRIKSVRFGVVISSEE